MPPEGRDLIRRTLHGKGVCFSFYEIARAQREYQVSIYELLNVHQAADAFIRDELSKGRYDPQMSKICFEMLLELFARTLKSDLGPRAGGERKVENVC